MRYESQLIKYMAVNPNISEEDYRTMIFGPTSDLGKNIFDPASGALLEGGEPLEVVDSDIVDYENIPMEEVYDIIRPMTPPMAPTPRNDVCLGDIAAIPQHGSRTVSDST